MLCGSFAASLPPTRRQICLGESRLDKTGVFSCCCHFGFLLDKVLVIFPQRMLKHDTLDYLDIWTGCGGNFNSISGQGRRMIVQRSNGAKGGRRWKECKSKSSSLNGNPRSSKSSKSCKPGVLRKPWKQGRLRGHMRLSSSKWKRFSELSFGLGLWECPPTGRYRWCLQLAVLPKCRDKQGQASEAAKQGRSVAAQAHAWKVQSEVEHQATISEI